MTTSYACRPSPVRARGFVVDVPLGIPEAAYHEPDVKALLSRYEAVLRVAGLVAEPDDEADREDWIEQATRITSCVAAASARGLPTYAVTATRGGPRLSPLDVVAARTDPKSLDLVLWGLVGDGTARTLSRDGHSVSDPFGGTPVYATNPGFLAHVGRRFVPCRADDDDLPERLAGLPAISDVLRESVGRPVVHKVIDGRLKEYAVERFVPTERELMPDHVAWSLVHRAMNLHSVQDDVPMHHEYRVFVVDGKVVSGAGSVMEFTPLDRLPGADTFDPRTRRDVRGRGVPGTPSVVASYVAVAQGIVDDVLADPGFPRHFVIDLHETADGGVGIVEMNPLRSSGYFANDADAVVRSAVACVTKPDLVLAPHSPEGVSFDEGPSDVVADLIGRLHPGLGHEDEDGPPSP